MLSARAFLVRGLLAGLIAGIVAFGVAFVVGEPSINAAIAFEEEAAAAVRTTLMTRRFRTSTVRKPRCLARSRPPPAC